MTSSPFLTPPPAEYVIGVTFGADCQFTLNRTDSSGNDLDWNSVVTIEFSVEDTPTTFTAFVNGSQALFTIPAATVNQVHNSTRWRIYMTTSGPTITSPVAVGTFRREDGGPTYCPPGGQVVNCGVDDGERLSLNDIRNRLRAGQEVSDADYQRLKTHNPFDRALRGRLSS